MASDSRGRPALRTLRPKRYRQSGQCSERPGNVAKFISHILHHRSGAVDDGAQSLYLGWSLGSIGAEMKMKHAAILFALAALSSMPLPAHHSFAAEFDAQKAIRLTGALTK